MNFITRDRIVLAIILLVFLVGCGSFRSMPPEKQVLLSYEVMGETIQTAKPILITLCDTGELSPEDCIEARAAYNNAVTVYYLLGETAKIAIDTGDNTDYQGMAAQLMTLLTMIQTYT